MEKNFTSSVGSHYFYLKIGTLLILKFQKSTIFSFIFTLFRLRLRLIIILVYYSQRAEVLVLEYNFFTRNRLVFRLVFLLDLLRVIFLLRVRLITVRVLTFRFSYIRKDKYFVRFHLLLIGFVLRIYFLILRPNLITVLLGWDGLGLTSYLLVIYYGRSKSYNSGIVTALTNRVGDALLLVRIGYLISLGNWNYLFYSDKQRLLVARLIIITATTKSAQIPFSAWLPAAIAAPTPVSSLVHSSTLVTAGVYLLVRHSEFLVKNGVSEYLLVIGRLTIVIARVRAFLERDLKKIVALSTLSQLGVIILSLGLGSHFARFFHLLRHAFFKALLFLGTGSIIHNRLDYQDIRVIGRGLPRLPVSHSRILLARFRLIGLPFISAFFSKEIILELIILKNFRAYIYFLMIIGILLTAVYRIRFLVYSFVAPTGGSRLGFKSDEDPRVVQGIIILILPAIVGGYWLGRTLFIRRTIRPLRLLSKSLVLGLLTSGVFLSILGYRSLWKLEFSRGVKRLCQLWMLTDLRTRPRLWSYKAVRVLIPKNFDRGFISYTSKIVQRTSFLLSLINRTKSSILKVVNLIVLWGGIIRVYYLCNKLHILKFRNKILRALFKTINSKATLFSSKLKTKFKVLEFISVSKLKMTLK